jgi:CheY-like chemotaxis protein
VGGILFIDAEQPFADQMVGSLKSKGFTVKLLDDGKDGLDYARDAKPDLIVLCVELPKMSGYSICNKLKKDNDLKGIPLIITSKEATPETFAQHKKLKTRAEDYLIKPFADGELVEKIGALIPLPAGGAAATASGGDSFDALDGLSAELGLGSAGGGESDMKLDDVDFATLDSPSNGGKAPDALGLSPEDDALLASLDDFGGDSSSPSAGLDDLELGGSEKDDGLLDNLEAITDSPPARPEPPKPAPKPEPRPEPRAAAPALSTPPTASAADLQQLSTLRRDNTDLKGKVAELEAKLRASEESARAKDQQIAAAASGGGGASSAREVLNLKEQLRTKEKEIGSFKDEVFEKEKANVELQEQIEQVKLEAQQKAETASKREVEISTLQGKIKALGEERDELEKTMQNRVAQTESERDTALGDAARAKNDLDRAKAFEDKLKSDLERVKGDLDAEKKLAAQQKQQLEAKIKEKEAEAREQEDRALKAYQRLKTEEAIREKAKKAAEIAFTLLSGDVDTGKKDDPLDLELDAE